MKSKLLTRQNEEKTFALIFDEGDEVIQLLTQFAKEQGIDAAHFTAVGAFQDVTLGYFMMPQMEYKKIPIQEQVEVLSLVGNVALDQKKQEPKIHAHVVVGKADATTRGGHIMEAHVRPTLEVILVEAPAHLKRQIDGKTGLALINLDATWGKANL